MNLSFTSHFSPLLFGDGKAELGSTKRRVLNPDFAVKGINYFFAYRKANAGAIIFVAAVQALENDKHFFAVLR